MKSLPVDWRNSYNRLKARNPDCSDQQLLRMAVTVSNKSKTTSRASGDSGQTELQLQAHVEKACTSLATCRSEEHQQHSEEQEKDFISSKIQDAPLSNAEEFTTETILLSDVEDKSESGGSNEDLDFLSSGQDSGSSAFNNDDSELAGPELEPPALDSSSSLLFALESAGYTSGAGNSKDQPERSVSGEALIRQEFLERRAARIREKVARLKWASLDRAKKCANETQQSESGVTDGEKLSAQKRKIKSLVSQLTVAHSAKKTGENALKVAAESQEENYGTLVGDPGQVDGSSSKLLPEKKRGRPRKPRDPNVVKIQRPVGRPRKQKGIVLQTAKRAQAKPSGVASKSATPPKRMSERIRKLSKNNSTDAVLCDDFSGNSGELEISMGDVDPDGKARETRSPNNHLSKTSDVNAINSKAIVAQDSPIRAPISILNGVVDLVSSVVDGDSDLSFESLNAPNHGDNGGKVMSEGVESPPKTVRKAPKRRRRKQKWSAARKKRTTLPSSPQDVTQESNPELRFSTRLLVKPPKVGEKMAAIPKKIWPRTVRREDYPEKGNVASPVKLVLKSGLHGSTLIKPPLPNFPRQLPRPPDRHSETRRIVKPPPPPPRLKFAFDLVAAQGVIVGAETSQKPGAGSPNVKGQKSEANSELRSSLEEYLRAEASRIEKSGTNEASTSDFVPGSSSKAFSCDVLPSWPEPPPAKVAKVASDQRNAVVCLFCRARRKEARMKPHMADHLQATMWDSVSGEKRQSIADLLYLLCLETSRPSSANETAANTCLSLFKAAVNDTQMTAEEKEIAIRRVERAVAIGIQKGKKDVKTAQLACRPGNFIRLPHTGQVRPAQEVRRSLILPAGDPDLDFVERTPSPSPSKQWPVGMASPPGTSRATISDTSPHLSVGDSPLLNEDATPPNDDVSIDPMRGTSNRRKRKPSREGYQTVGSDGYDTVVVSPPPRKKARQPPNFKQLNMMRLTEEDFRNRRSGVKPIGKIVNRPGDRRPQAKVKSEIDFMRKLLNSLKTIPRVEEFPAAKAKVEKHDISWKKATGLGGSVSGDSTVKQEPVEAHSDVTCGIEVKDEVE